MGLKRKELDKIQAIVNQHDDRTEAIMIPCFFKNAFHYPVAHFRSAFFFLLVSLIGVFYYLPLVSTPDFSMLFFIPVFGFLFGHIIAYWWSIKRFFLIKRDIESHTRSKALELFHQLQMTSSSDRSGVLIAFFEQENKVEIIADIGFAKYVQRSFWDDIVSLMKVGIMHPKFTENFKIVSDKICEIHQFHFPKRQNIN